ncbi:hypothetical protein BH18ACT13_BH18ACT13_12570 [soil metagenome]
MAASDEARGIVEAIPTREYGWVVAFMVWLSGLSAVAALAGFAVGYEAVIDERGVGGGVFVGVVSALLSATPLLALAVLVYLLREVAISAARIDGWAEANFELDRLTADPGDTEAVAPDSNRDVPRPCSSVSD